MFNVGIPPVPLPSRAADCQNESNCPSRSKSNVGVQRSQLWAPRSWTRAPAPPRPPRRQNESNCPSRSKSNVGVHRSKLWAPRSWLQRQKEFNCPSRSKSNVGSIEVHSGPHARLPAPSRCQLSKANVGVHRSPLWTPRSLVYQRPAGANCRKQTCGSIEVRCGPSRTAKCQNESNYPSRSKWQTWVHRSPLWAPRSWTSAQPVPTAQCQCQDSVLKISVGKFPQCPEKIQCPQCPENFQTRSVLNEQ